MESKLTHINDLFESANYIYAEALNEKKEKVLFKRHYSVVPSKKIFDNYHHEKEVLEGLNLDCTLKFNDIFFDENYLCCAYDRQSLLGLPLQTYDFNEFSTKEWLYLFLEISKIVNRLHQKGIVFKNITPNSILLDSTSKKLTFLDFDLAINMESQTHSFLDPCFNSAFPFISPEQTKRIDRTIDFRSDLYMLGATFYYVLTGEQLFGANSRISQFHFHLAAPVKEDVLKNKGISRNLQQIIKKLIQKDPLDRYQSTTSLIADLEQVIQAPESDDHNLVIGFEDTIPEVNLNQYYIKPVSTFNQICNVIQNPIKHRNVSMMLRGPRGVGKSRMIEELQIQIEFISLQSKCIEGYEVMPYFVWKQIVSQIINYCLWSFTPQGNHQNNEELNNSIIDIDNILLSVFPRLSLLMDEASLEERSLQNSHLFHYAFQSFLDSFLQLVPQALIIIEDIQYADKESLDLLEVILINLEAYNNRILITNNQTINGSAARAFFKKNSAKFLTFSLSSFSLNDAKQWIQKLFNISTNNAERLHKVIFDQTAGNPGLMKEVISLALKNNLIWYDSRSQNWQWNFQKIKAIDLGQRLGSIRELEELNENGDLLKFLKWLALIQYEFTKTFVCHLANWSDLDGLFDLAQENLFIQLMDSSDEGQYFLKLPSPLWNELLSEIALEDQLEIRKKIISQLEKVGLADQYLTLQELVHQFNVTVELGDEQDKVFDILVLNTRLADIELERFSFGRASYFYQQALNLMDNNQIWEENYDFALGLYNQYANASYQNGAYLQSIAICDTILRRSNTLTDSVEAVITKMEALKAQDNFDLAIKEGLNYLSNLGIQMSSNPQLFSIIRQFLKLRLFFMFKGEKGIVQMKMMSLKKPQCAARVMLSLGPLVHIQYPSLLAKLMLEQLELVIKYGHVPHSPYLFANYGMVLCGQMKDVNAGYYFGKLAEKLTNLIQNDKQHLRAMFSLQFFVFHWKRPLSETIAEAKNINQLALKFGDYEYAAYSKLVIISHSLARGVPLQRIQQELWTFVKNTIDFNQIPVLNYLKIIKVFLERLTDQNNNSQDLAIEYPIDSLDRSGQALFYLLNAILCYLMGQFERSLHFLELRQMIKDSGTSTVFSILALFYEALAKSAYLEKNFTKALQSKTLRFVRNSCRQFERWSSNCPENFQPLLLLLVAEKERIKSNYAKARIIYDKAINSSLKYGMLHIEAIALERISQLLSKMQAIIQAEIYLHKARECYFNWGAFAKVVQLEQNYHLDESLNKENNHDLFSVVRASNMLASSFSYKDLISNLMDVIITNLGAQDGLLFIYNEGELFLESFTNSADQTKKSMLSLNQALKGGSQNNIETSVIEYVEQERKPYLSSFEDTLNDQVKRGKSVLCFPLLLQNRLIGIIYLENRLIAGAFQEKHLNFLQLLGGQAAAAIKNAILYREMEGKVKERTKVLEHQKLEIDEQKKRLELQIDFKNQLIKKNKELQRKTIKTLEKEAEVKTVNAMYDAAETERLRIAEELHHSVNSSITAIQLNFESLGDLLQPQKKEIIGTIGQLLKTTSAKVRSISHNLAPLEVYKMGLFMALQVHIESIESSKCEIAYNLDALDFEDRFEEKKELILYHASLELINNAQRHGQASQIDLSVAYNQNHLVLKVEDDGIGYNPTKESEGFGLSMIRSRILNINGVFKIDSNPSLGTFAQITVPVQLR